MNLHLTEAERAHLLALGVAAGADGTLRSSSGRTVDAGAAIVLLSKAVSPADFQRGYLRDGHAAGSAAQWTIGAPGDGHVARTGAAGPPGPIGSGTADRTMAAADDDDLVPGGDEDGEGVGPPDGADLAKGLVPDRFMRGYLSQGHQADSPANTGQRGTTAVPGSGPAEPQDFRRGWLQPGHEDADPANDPMGNNPHPGGTPGAAVYRTAAGCYGDNQARVAAEHLMPSQHITAEPAACRPVMPPGDMRAASVPQAVQVMATRPAPGERQS